MGQELVRRPCQLGVADSRPFMAIKQPNLTSIAAAPTPLNRSEPKRRDSLALGGTAALVLRVSSRRSVAAAKIGPVPPGVLRDETGAVRRWRFEAWASSDASLTGRRRTKR